MSRRQRAYFSAVAGPVLLVSAFLTAGLALARLDPGASLPALEVTVEGGITAESGPSNSRAEAPAAFGEGAGELASATGDPGPLNPAVLTLQVNFAHDWVAGNTDPGASVAVTVTDSGLSVKAEAVVTADGGGNFFVACEDWLTGGCPDIIPGDRVEVSAAGLLSAIDPVGRILGTIDVEEQVVRGVLHAAWFSVPLEVTLWVDYAFVYSTTVSSDGGTFEIPASFGSNQLAELSYLEPDGDSVVNVLTWPWVRVNYGYDQVGANYGEGHSFSITVTDSGGSVKATGTAESVLNGGWGGDGFEGAAWTQAQPDILPGDYVFVAADDGYANALQIGEIGGTVDVEADTVSGPITATWFITVASLDVACHPWGAWSAGLGDAPVKHSTASPDGSTPFTCSWDPATEWDVQPGQDVGVMYFEPDGDRVIDVEREPAAHLRVATWVEGSAGEGGNLKFHHRYENIGDAMAENVVITDTLSGMTYLFDTSSFAVTTGTVGAEIETIQLDVGTVPAASGGEFDLYVDVIAVAGETITETVEIATSGFNQAGPDETAATWVGQVQENDTRLAVAKWAWTADPAPGEDVVFTVNVCNNGATGSSSVTLEDTLSQLLTLQDWWAQHPGWYESDSHQLTVANPSIPGHSCSEVYVRATVDPGAIGTVVSNEAVITAANDLDSDNNAAFWEGTVSAPHANLWIDKWWNRGQLVPGGELVYGVGYGNNGNVAVGPVAITETFPVGTSFVDAWHHDPHGGYAFQPTTVTDDYAVWDLPDLDNGSSGSFDVRVSVNLTTAPGTILVNQVAISPQPVEDSYDDNTAEWAEYLGAEGPNLRVAKSHSWHGNHTLDYEVRFDNVGDQAVADIVITDTLPADTTWGGWWELGFDPARVDLDDGSPNSQLVWNLTELLPGETGRLWFNAILGDPGAPLQWYTNTAEITTPVGDTNPGDNVADDVAFSGGEVRWFEIQVAGRDVWGFAPRGPVTVTTESEQVVLEVDGDFGWTFDQPLLPGQTITVTADAGLQPVVIEIPNPFDAQGSSIDERVWGQIDQLDGETIEVFFHGGPTLLGATDASGFFEVVFHDIPRGASGEVRYVTEVAYADVVFHRIWQTPDVVVDVNYAHDWVAGRAVESESVQVVLGEVGVGPVAQAVVAPDDMGFFFVGCGDWDDGACPDVLPGHVVDAEASSGFTTTVEIGAITGVLDVEADTLSGTVEAAWFTEPLAGSCEVWVEGGPAIEFEVEPNGGSYQCDLAAVWDLVPGQDVAVRYREPDGDSVIDVYREPAPWLRIEKSGVGDAAEGGNFRYQIAVWNDGGASAESVVVTDTLPVGSTYITDTSGLPMSGAGAGPVVWQAGTLDPGQRLEFDLYVDVAAPVSEPITNTVEVTTATPFDAGEPADKVSEWVEEVQPNDTHLTVAKWSRTPDPAPGEDFLFVVNVCNEGTTGSTEVTLTDTFVPLLALVDWQTGNPAWREVSRVDGELVLAIPSIASNSCSRVRMTMFLDAAAEVGQLLTNSAVIAADNDLETNDNEAFWEALVTEPRLNLAVEKRFDSGVLVPGGSIRYTVDYANNGNVAVAGPVFITDTFPAGTTFVSAWHNTWWGGYDFPPTVLTPELAVWELSGLDNSVGGNFDVLLTIDEDVLPGTLLRNWVEISPQEGEASYDDNTSGWDELVRESGVNLRVVKEHDWNDDRSVLAYDVRFDNIGTDPVASVAITDTLPAGTSWDGTWSMDFDWDRLDGDIVAGGGQLVWHFTEIRPGESGHLRFGAALESPQAPLDFYTNTVEITVPAGEIDLDDNVYEDVAAGSGEVAGIDIEKLTNGVDADTAPGPEILVGSPVTWTYTVSNIGSVDLSQIEITDDRLGTICTITSLQTGDPPATCTATGVAEEGPYGNVGMVVGHPPTGNPVADTDASHYVGGTLIFADEFESGDTSAWDGRAPP